jgi:hypothetical protein
VLSTISTPGTRVSQRMVQFAIVEAHRCRSEHDVGCHIHAELELPHLRGDSAVFCAGLLRRKARSRSKKKISH